MAAVDYYPPLGFYYKVEFSISKQKDDVRFQSVSGLSVEVEMESYKEGGENRFEHKLPGRTKYTDLTLKRGMLVNSDIVKWCMEAIQNHIFLNLKDPHQVRNFIYPASKKLIGLFIHLNTFLQIHPATLVPPQYWLCQSALN